jgi:crotonobetainyl-CoA:carnitine CoA-transferase CaiB-like acyl-CoA transferase
MGSEKSDWLFDSAEVIDMSTGFTGALAAHLLTELGASVTRVAPRGEDPFTSVSPAYRLWRSRQVTVECPSRDDLDARLTAADACILGGDDHPSAPRVIASEEVAARHDHLVVLDITGTVPGSAYGAMPANDILAQARSGLSNEQFSDRPIVFGLRFPSYGAVLHGLIGLSAALHLREATGQGGIVRTSFIQGAAAWMTPVWIRAERPHHAMNGIMPKDVAWPIYECSDASWLTYAQGTSGAEKRTSEVLGLEVAQGRETLVSRTATGVPASTSVSRKRSATEFPGGKARVSETPSWPQTYRRRSFHPPVSAGTTPR